MSESLLNIRGINKRFGGLQALSEVSLSIKRGEIYGLIGPNGAGKTTLLKMVSGLESPTDGLALIDGLELYIHINYTGL